MEIIELRRGDFIYRGAAGRGMGVLTVPGMWPLCYSWIGYLQANGSAVSPALWLRGSLMCHIGMPQMTRTLQ